MGLFTKTDCDRFGHWWGRPFIHAVGQHEGLHYQKVTTRRIRRCERCKTQDEIVISAELSMDINS